MDIPTLIALFGGIAGIIGCIGGLYAVLVARKTAQDTVRIAREAKVDPHRAAVYEKQVEALSKITEVWGQYTVQDAPVSGFLPANFGDSVEAFLATKQTAAKIYEVSAEFCMTLPPQCLAELAESENRVTSARTALVEQIKRNRVTMSENGEAPDMESLKQDFETFHQEVFQAWISVLGTARKVLEIEPLTKETQDILQRLKS